MSRLFRIFAFCALIIASLGTPTPMRAQDASARLTCRIEPAPLALNGQATLILEIANIQNLFGYELKMTYDASRVQVQDGDAEKAGTNLQVAGMFLNPDFVVVNSAENGTITLALTQLGPDSRPKSGGGEVARATMTGIGAGFANFAFGDVVFSDNNGLAIPVTKEDCLVEIGEAGQPTPTFTATSVATATPTNTEVPTQQATVSVSQQSQAATATPMPQAPTSTPVPMQTSAGPAVTTATSLPAETPTPGVVTITTPTPDPQGQFSQTDATPMPSTEIVPTETPTPLGEQASSQSSTPAPPTVGQDVVTPSTGEVRTENETEPKNNTQEMSASGKESTQVAMVESVRTATATPTPTLVVIERVAQAAPLAVGAVQQPAPTAQPAARGLLQGRGWFFLLLTGILAVAVWRLRRGSPSA